MGCQATELNHFTKPFKMDLTLTNRRFNFDKFRVHEIDLSNVRRFIPGLPGRSGLLDEGRLTRGFRLIHLASKLGLIAYYKGPLKLFVAMHKEPPSNFVSCAQWVPMFDCAFATLSLASK